MGHHHPSYTRFYSLAVNPRVLAMQFIQTSIPNHKPPHNPNPSSTTLPYKYRQENSSCSLLNIRRKWSSALLEPLPRISPSTHSSLRTTFISHRKPLSVSIEPRFVAPIQVCSRILFIFFKFLQPSRGGGELVRMGVILDGCGLALLAPLPLACLRKRFCSNGQWNNTLLYYLGD